MKLFYHDARTPMGYQPPYFEAANETLDPFRFACMPLVVDFGSVVTPFHEYGAPCVATVTSLRVRLG